MSNVTLKPLTAFERYAESTQAILKRAATRGTANSTPEAFADVGRDWVMVETKKGLRQVVITAKRAVRL